MSYYNNICSQDRFAADIKNHEMIILRDDGVYRHLRFKKPDSFSYHFDLITWPNYLAITGDMGADLFCRTNDMFEFFRTDRGHGKSDINPAYWGEKIQTDGRASHKEWVANKFNATITELLNEYLAGCELDEEEQEKLREKVNYWLLNPENEHQAINNLMEWQDENFSIELCDFPDCAQFTFHYIWRCRAIAFGIQQYDEKTTETP